MAHDFFTPHFQYSNHTQPVASGSPLLSWRCHVAPQGAEGQSRSCRKALLSSESWELAEGMDCRLCFGELNAQNGTAGAAGETTFLAGSCFTSSAACGDFAVLTFSSMTSRRSSTAPIWSVNYVSSVSFLPRSGTLPLRTILWPAYPAAPIAIIAEKTTGCSCREKEARGAGATFGGRV
jgi:hypothetical protein